MDATKYTHQKRDPTKIKNLSPPWRGFLPHLGLTVIRFGRCEAFKISSWRSSKIWTPPENQSLPH
ncbi:hypothetical protein CGERO_09435 [Corynebacterium gerontici]|uniref:Uncharacterized protein n=1 Tax=Corynebacterium gerontici TaxID=2079234 RepID=A0A3G6J5H7_9CORY|nr:hypothetical protein CGERO_09435 [Corynebacterium gerontici]